MSTSQRITLAYHWTAWSFSIGMASLAALMVIANTRLADAQPGVFVILCLVAVISAWAYNISLARLAHLLGRRWLLWVGLSLLVPMGSLVALLKIRSVARSHPDWPRGTIELQNGAKRTAPTTDGLPTTSTGVRTLPPTTADPALMEMRDGAAYMMILSQPDCRKKTSSQCIVPVESRALFELSVLDAFSVIHATYPALLGVAGEASALAGARSLAKYAAARLLEHYPEHARVDTAWQLLVERLDAYQSAYVRGTEEQNGPFWAVAKAYLAFCGRDMDAVLALTATECAGLKFKHTAELLDEIAAARGLVYS